MKVWEAKHPSEIITATFHFGTELGDATIIPNTPVLQVIVTAGADGSPSAILNGAPSINAGDVFQSFRDGVNGVYYKLLCQVNTSDGRRLIRQAILPVRA